MALLVILIGLVVQRYLHFLSVDYRWAWFDRYFIWMAEKVEPVTKGHALLRLAILVLPPVLMVGILFGIIYHLTGLVGYFILSAIWFWYCVDGRDTQKRPYTMQSPNVLLDNGYRTVFGVIFWFAVFGPLGLTLYYMVTCVCDELSRLKDERMQSTLAYGLKVQAILDWVPARLLALSFAVVGHFSKVMGVWLKQLLSGLDAGITLLRACATAALDAAEQSDQLTAMYNLLNRALLVWLFIIALVTLGIFLG